MKNLLGLFLLALNWGESASASALLEAEKAIQEGADLSAYAIWKPHPLYPVLQAAYLSRNADRVQEIEWFLKRYAHSSLSAPLALSAYRHWLPQRPQQIVQTYNEVWSTPEINCFYQNARRQLGQKPVEALPLAPQCLHLFSVAQLRQHIKEAMRGKKSKVVQEALQYLPESEALAAQQWLNNEPIQHPVWRSMALAQQIHQLSGKKLEEALLLARSEPLLEHDDYRYAYNRLLSQLARQNHAATYEIWAKMPAGTQQDNTILDLIAYVLRRHDWDLLPQLLSHLDEKALAGAEIQYWLARAKEKQGRMQEALQHYRKAAAQRDYFGFLAAGKIQQKPQLQHEAIRTHVGIQNRLGTGIARALLFRQLGQHQWAQREWQALAKNRSREEIEQIALLLHQNQWTLPAITLLAQHQLWNALEVRFPIYYRPHIQKLAAQHRLKPSEILAIIRKESIFQEQVKSSAGAIGLMQIMPRTASDTAKRYGIPYAGQHQLVQPEINLIIGTQYLSDRLQEFGHLAYAAAAYNAGPSRVRQWLAAHPQRPLDEWIALIPFNETRDYVKKVLEYEKIYAELW